MVMLKEYHVWFKRPCGSGALGIYVKAKNVENARKNAARSVKQLFGFNLRDNFGGMECLTEAWYDNHKG
jgi:hypothetical protein